MARGSVWVRPGRLPAKVTVAPNSPIDRAQASTAPADNEGSTIGSEMVRATAAGVAPSVAAASSSRRSTVRKAPSIVTTTNGSAT